MSIVGRRTDTEPTVTVNGLLDDLAARLKSFEDRIVPSIFSAVSDVVVARIRSVSQVTANMTPSWKLFIDDAKVNTTLAKRTLLQGVAKQQLPVVTEKQYQFMVSVADAFAAWGLPPPTSHEATSKECEHATEILEYGRMTAVVIAGVYIVAELPQAQRPAAAAAFLDNCPDGSPAALKQLLSAARGLAR